LGLGHKRSPLFENAKVDTIGPITENMKEIKYEKQTHGEAMLTSVSFNEDGLHPYIGKDSTESVTCKLKTTRLLTKN
jgi:hypothetical protein